MKAIVIYYSRSGKTADLAQRICAGLACGALRAEALSPYGSYIGACLRTGLEGTKLLPAQTAATPLPDLSDVGAVLAGFPIWQSDPPVFFGEFLSRCDLKGKKLIPFATYATSGIKHSLKTLRRLCPDADITLPFGEGRFRRDDYEAWLTSVRALLAEA